VAAVVLVAAGGSGERLGGLRLGPGTAWFGSSADGSVALLDGLSGDRLGRVKVAESGERLEVVQSRTAALVVNRSRGTVRRVDGASLEAGPVKRLGAVEDAELRVVSNAEAVWALQQGGTLAAQLDPVGVDPLGAPVGLGGAPSSVALTPSGWLWVDGPGGLRSLRAGRVRSQSPQAGPGEVVVAVGSRAVVVDPAARSARVVDPESGRRGRGTCLGDATADSLVSGSGPKGRWVLAVAPSAGGLVVGDVGSGKCQLVVAGDPGPDRYGPATESEGRVYVPDYREQAVVVVDPDKGSVLGRVHLGVPAGHRFRLFAHDSLLWWDDPEGDTAGVVTAGLVALSVSKTTGPGRGGKVPQPDSAPAPGGVACRATPARPAVGETVVFEATADDPQPVRWEWSFPGGRPATASGARAESRWATAGDRVVTVTATYADRPSASATCTIGADRPGGPKPSGPTSTSTPPPCRTPPCQPPPPPPPPPCPKPPCPPSTTTTKKGTTSTTPGSTTTTQPPSTTSTTAPTSGPVAAFTVSANPAAAGDPVTFTDTSSGQPTQWQWTFPNGNPSSSTERNPVVTWADPGTYTVGLSVAAGGAADSTQQQLTVTSRSGIPDLFVSAQMSDANGGTLMAGDPVGATITVDNVGTADATNTVVTVNLTNLENPTGVAENGGSASFDSTPSTLTVRIGTGVTGTSGGTISPDDFPTSVTFNATVVANPSGNPPMAQVTASVSFEGGGVSPKTTSVQLPVMGPPQITLGIVPTPAAPGPVPRGSNITYDVVVTNPPGGAPAVNLTVAFSVSAPQTVIVGAGTLGGTAAIVGPGTVTATYPTLAPGATATLFVDVQVQPSANQTPGPANDIVANATVTYGPGSNPPATAPTVAHEISGTSRLHTASATGRAPVVAGRVA
jgi:PKD repeat protein